jgi:hypothetical protein
MKWIKTIKTGGVKTFSLELKVNEIGGIREHTKNQGCNY